MLKEKLEATEILRMNLEIEDPNSNPNPNWILRMDLEIEERSKNEVFEILKS